MKFGIIVSARFSSTRLPGKALLPIAGMPMLEYLLQRLQGSIPVFLATTTRNDDLKLSEVAKKIGVDVFRGDCDDVVSRYVQAADHFGINYPIRITADCPFMDAATVQFCVEQIGTSQFDIATTKGIFPVGIDLEIYSQESMRRLHELNSLTKEEREHLTLHFYNSKNNFKIIKFQSPSEWPLISDLRDAKFTVDTPTDYEFAKELVSILPVAPSVRDVLLASQKIKPIP